MDRTVYIDIAGKKYPMRFSLGVSKALSEKFGSLDLMMEAMQNKNQNETLNAIIWVIEAMIKQGCAYKNLFEADMPTPEDAPVKDGKYTPLTTEQLEIGIDFADLIEIKNNIFRTITGGSGVEVETKEKEKTGKNAETT